MLYTFAAREQSALYFDTYGQSIEDDLNVLLKGLDLP